MFTQVGRLVRASGLFAFHVNSLEDRPMPARALSAQELEPDYAAEESGQTVHFFSEASLRAPGRMAAGATGPGLGSAPQDGRAIQACLARHSPALNQRGRGRLPVKPTPKAASGTSSANYRSNSAN
jgi:hypothetical protein